MGALESTRAEARESSRSALSEANLRAELSVCKAQRDEAVTEAEESKRKATLVQEEMRSVKAKLARVTQEKLKMERDQRATLSLAKSLDQNTTQSGPNDYYKRKISDLTSQVQSLNAVIAEKNRQLDETRRQVERNMTQNRLAQLRRGLGGSRKRGHE